MARPIGVIESKPRKRNAPRATKGELAQRLERLRAAGVLQGTSSAVLYAICDKEYWLKVLGELERVEDWRTISELLKFHQSMRDGRPAQQITVTSVGVQFSADEIAHARAVVRELTKANAPALTIVNPPVLTADVIDGDNPTIPIDEVGIRSGIMSLEGQGSEKGGEGG